LRECLFAGRRCGNDEELYPAGYGMCGSVLRSGAGDEFAGKNSERNLQGLCDNL
jgi:hypothetical protein